MTATENYKRLPETITFEDLLSYPMEHMSNDERDALNKKNIKLYQQTKDLDYITELFRLNVPVIRQFIKQYQRKLRSYTKEDLCISVFMGLYKAARRFDLKSDNRFMTYAIYWIRQQIVSDLADTDLFIKFPRGQYSKITKMFNLTNENIPFAEKCQLCNSNEKEMRMLMQMYSVPKSLDEVLTEDNNITLGDSIEDPNIPDFSELYLGKEIKQVLQDSISKLTEKEQQVIKMRFGIGNYELMTLETIGKILGVSKERIRQMEVKAIRKLRIIMKKDLIVFRKYGFPEIILQELSE